MSYQVIHQELRVMADKRRAIISQSFFKTGPGQYGQGDQFIGLTVPQLRILAKTYAFIAKKDINALLTSKIHEERLLALLILNLQFSKANEQKKKEIVEYYLSKTEYINNWDLVDSSAYQILGEYLVEKKRTILTQLAKSPLLWERRIVIVATFAFIRRKDYQDTLKIAQLLLKDNHDLIHKAVGWMLREVGKKDEKVLMEFLNTHAKKMPRTMLRYAIERLPSNKKNYYLN